MPESAAGIRSRLPHPVVDADGHMLECMPAVLSHLRAIAGAGAATRLTELLAGRDGSAEGRLLEFLGWIDLSADQRADRRVIRTPWWVAPTSNTVDRATAMLPRLLHERLPELGIDFSVVYPSLGLLAGSSIADAELRQATCRALNTYYAESFDGLGDRLRPVAVIPVHTPAEAMDELDFAVEELGFRAIMIRGGVLRPVPAIERAAPQEGYVAPWMDLLALDSAHDYDPFWARCAELGVAVASHGGTAGFGTRRSTSNFMFNHSGHFAAAGEALAKAVFLGGVTHRFPSLNFAFLEGGVHWAVALLNDMAELWENRGGGAVAQFDPARLDLAALRGYVDRYGDERYREQLAEHVVSLGTLSAADGDAAARDEWRLVGASSEDELIGRFVDSFWFGCEADDALVPLAFDRRLVHGGRALNAMFSSDIGHYDVPDMTRVVGQAHALVADGGLDDDAFEAFMFSNAARFYLRGDPEFFRGTTVERAAAALIDDRDAVAAPG